MKHPMARAIVIGSVLGLVTLGVIVLAVRSSMRHTCEVCLEFRGRSSCREAVGTSTEEARKTATDNACAFLASGMTDSIECMNVRPLRVTCDP